MNNEEKEVQKALGTVETYHVYAGIPVGGRIDIKIVVDVTSKEDVREKAQQILHAWRVGTVTSPDVISIVDEEDLTYHIYEVAKDEYEVIKADDDQ